MHVIVCIIIKHVKLSYMTISYLPRCCEIGITCRSQTCTFVGALKIRNLDIFNNEQSGRMQEAELSGNSLVLTDIYVYV